MSASVRPPAPPTLESRVGRLERIVGDRGEGLVQDYQQTQSALARLHELQSRARDEDMRWREEKALEEGAWRGLALERWRWTMWVIGGLGLSTLLTLCLVGWLLWRSTHH